MRTSLGASKTHSWLDVVSSFGALVGPAAVDTTLESARRIGTDVAEAVHAAIAEARQVRWTPRARPPARPPDLARSSEPSR